MTRRAQRTETLRHEQLLDRLDLLTETMADVLDGALRLAAHPLVVTDLGAADDSRLKAALDHLTEALDAEKMSNAQLFSAMYAQEQRAEMYRSGLRRAVAMIRRQRAEFLTSRCRYSELVDAFGGQVADLKAQLAAVSTTRHLETISSLRTDVGRLTQELAHERATVETLRQQLKAEQAEAASLRTDLRRAAQAQVFSEVATSSNSREAVLKAAVEKQKDARTEGQVRQYGNNVRALWSQGIMPAEIARRVNRDLGLSKSALSSYDVTRMAAAMGLGAQA